MSDWLAPSHVTAADQSDDFVAVCFTVDVFTLEHVVGEFFCSVVSIDSLRDAKLFFFWGWA